LHRLMPVRGPYTANCGTVVTGRFVSKWLNRALGMHTQQPGGIVSLDIE